MDIFFVIIFLMFFYYSIPYYQYIFDKYVLTFLINGKKNKERWVFVKSQNSEEANVAYIIKKLENNKVIVKLYNEIANKILLVEEKNIIKKQN